MELYAEGGPMMRRVQTLLISLLALAFVASSCGSSPESPWTQAAGSTESDAADTRDGESDDSESAVPPPTTTVTAAQSNSEAVALVLTAFAATTEVQSTRLAMTIEMGGMPDMGSGPVVLAMDVAVSADGTRSRMLMDFGDLLAAVPSDDLEAMGPLLSMFAEPFETRSADGVTYMTAGFFAGMGSLFGIPSIETPWVAFADDGSFGEGFNFEQSQFSAEQFLVVLHGMGESAEIIGTETMDGAITTHVRGTFSPASLAAADVEWDVSEFDMTGVMDFGVELFEIDVWIDDSDLVRRLVFGVSDLAALDPTAPAGAFFSFRIDLGDSNQPVVIEIPAEADVTWLDDLSG